MNDVEVAQKVLELIEANNIEGAASHLADSFTFSGATPEPVSGEMWLGLHGTINAAFPDFSFNLAHAHQHGDVVHVSVELSGTQANDFDLSGMDLPTVPSEGKSFKLPTEELSFSVADGKITALTTPHVEGGGLMGILAQLGVEPPAH